MSYSIKLNHGTSSLDYVKEILKCMSEGNLEQKFFYCNTLCAYNWIHLVEDKQHYRLADQSSRMFDGYVKRLLKDYIDEKNISVVSLGVGNGYDDKQLISNILRQNKQKKIIYYPYDVSHELITYANKQVHSIPNSLGKIETIAIEDDFKNIQNYSDKFKSDAKMKLFCFLGSTISNFHETKLLSKIKEVMTNDDFLLIGVDCALDRVNELELQNHSADSFRGLNFLYGPIKSMLAYIQIPEIDNPLSFNIDDKFKRSIETLDNTLIKPETSTSVESEMNRNGDVCTIAYNLPTIGKIINFSHKYKTETVENYLTRKLQFQIIDRVTTKDTHYSHVYQPNDTCSYSLFLVKKRGNIEKTKLTDYEITNIRSALGKSAPPQKKEGLNAAFFIDALKANMISNELFMALLNATDYSSLKELKDKNLELAQMYYAQKNIQENGKR